MRRIRCLQSSLPSVLVMAALVASTIPALAAESTPGLRGHLSSESGAALDEVEVIILELKREARTDENGNFQFGEIPQGTYTVMIQGLGFAPVTRTLALPTGEPLEVTLESRVLEMAGVEVTGSRVPRPALDSPLPTARLSHHELERETGISVAHAVEELPGVRVVSTGQQIGKPMIRGLTGARVLMLDDGHRIEDYSWSDEDGPSVDPTSAERIEVVRGPASLMYGSDAIGGVINTLPPEVPETEEGEAAFFRGKPSFYYGTNNSEFGLGLNLEGARADWGWRFNVIGRKAESFQTPDEEVEHTGFESVNGDAALGVHGRKGNASIRYARYGGEFKLLEGGGPPPGQEEGEEEGPERKSSDDRVQFNGNLLAGSTRFEAKAQWQAHSLIELSDEFLPEGEGAPSLHADRHESTILAPATAAEKREMEAFNLLLHTTTLDLMAHHRLGSNINGTAGVTGFLQ
ncbi:MAG TPA: TonB-dependent receptor, partial [Candidatus Eisenbacteria bacterium]